MKQFNSIDVSALKQLYINEMQLEQSSKSSTQPFDHVLGVKGLQKSLCSLTALEHPLCMLWPLRSLQLFWNSLWQRKPIQIRILKRLRPHMCLITPIMTLLRI